MQRIKRLRPRLTKLWWTFLVLAICSAALAFFAGRELEQGFANLLYASVAIALVFLWLIPSLAYAGTFVDVYQHQLVFRRGIFGMKPRTVLVSEIEQITASAVRGVTIRVRDQESLVLKGYPKPKQIAADLNALAK